jgi:acyl-CoA thioester hydrolase
MNWPCHLAVVATIRDTDCMGHVNNAVYLTWTEEIRTRYIIDRRGWNGLDDVDFVLGSARIDYRSSVFLEETVDIWCGPSRVGTKSWDFLYVGKARSDGRVVFQAHTVQVQYDYGERRAVPIPHDWRKMLEEDLIPGPTEGTGEGDNG